MEATWSSHYAADPAKGADATLPANVTSSVLVDTGRRLAEDGRHAEARQVLTRAFLLVQMQLEAASNAREREIENAGDEVHVELRRPVAYTAVKQLYDRLREISRFTRGSRVGCERRGEPRTRRARRAKGRASVRSSTGSSR